MSKYCPFCGASIAKNFKFCPECKANLTSIKDNSVSPSKGNTSFNISQLHPIAIVVCVIVVILIAIGCWTDHTIFPAIAIIIGYICGEYAAKNWAPKINGSQSWAFVVPFLFNLLGLACYWFYYKYKLERKMIFLIGLSFIVLIIILLFVGYVVYAVNSSNSGTTTTTTITTTTYSYKTVETYTVVNSFKSLQYSDPTLGFKVYYPETWKYQKNVEPYATWVTDTTFTSNDGKSGFQIQVSNSVPAGYDQVSSADEWAKNGIEIMKSDKNVAQLNIISNEKTTLSGFPAQKIEYTAVYSGTKLHDVQYFIINGEKGYNIFFYSTDDEFNNRWNIGQAMFDTLEITK